MTAMPESLPKHRVEALTDGIYAVAMTLLVLELKLPDIAGPVTEPVLGAELLHLLPKALAWVISFFILATFWLSHQRAFQHVCRVDTRLAWINVVSLMLASLLPFSSALVGEYPGLFAPQVVYAGNLAALALAAIWQVDHLERHAELCIPPSFPRAVARATRFRCWSLAAVAALAVTIALFDPRFGTVAFMLMIVLRRIGRARESRAAAPTPPTSSERSSP